MFFPIQAFTAGTHDVPEGLRFLRADATAGDVALNLPAGIAGPSYFVKRLDDTAHALTINAPSGKTIDGLSSFALTVKGQCVWILRQADGTYDVLAGGAGGTTISRDVDFVTLGSDQALGTGFAAVTGMSRSVVLATAGKVTLGASGRISGSFLFGGGLEIRVDDGAGGVTDYLVAEETFQVGAEDDNVSEITLSGSAAIPLLNVGTYTVSLRAYSAVGSRTLLAGATLIIEYPVLSGFAGVLGSAPSGPASGDLSGTYPGPTVVGLQGNLLPTSLAAKFIRRKADDSGWEKVGYGSAANTVTEGSDARLSDARTPTGHHASHESGGSDPVKLDDLAAPDDTTDLDVSTSRHGLAPKLPNDATKYLDGTGAYSVPGGGGGGGVDLSEVLWLKSFFDDNGFLPANLKKNLLKSIDVFDSVSGGGSIAYSPGVALADAHEIYATYDLGAGYTKILLVCALVGASTTNQGIFFCNTLSSGVPQNGQMFMNEMNSSRSSLYNMPGFSSIWLDGSAWTSASPNTARPMMAMYIDLAAHRIVTFYRYGAEMWWVFRDTTDAAISLSSAQYAGAYVHSGPARIGCPFAIYAQ